MKIALWASQCVLLKLVVTLKPGLRYIVHLRGEGGRAPNKFCSFRGLLRTFAMKVDFLALFFFFFFFLQNIGPARTGPAGAAPAPLQRQCEKIKPPLE